MSLTERCTALLPSCGFPVPVLQLRLASLLSSFWKENSPSMVPARVYIPFPYLRFCNYDSDVELRTNSCFDGDSCRCAMSLRSELRIVKRLLKIGKKCLSPKLKVYAPDLH